MQQEPEIAQRPARRSAPRLLINLADVPATNLLQPGNRATYRLLVADPVDRRRGSTPTSRWAEAKHCSAGQRIENVRDLRPEVRQTLERAEQFLGLAALVAVILAAVAVALAASRYLRRHLDTAAMLRCLGAPERQTLTLFVLQFAVLGVLASAAGRGARARRRSSCWCCCSTGSRPPAAAARRSRPRLRRSAPALLLLFGFALPPLLALAGAPPLRVLRRDLPRPRPGGVAAYVLGAAVIALLIGVAGAGLRRPARSWSAASAACSPRRRCRPGG